MKALRLLPALAVAAVLGLAPGLALADPGNGRGNGITNNPNVPPGQSTKDIPQPQPQPQPQSQPKADVGGTGTPCDGCVGKADDKSPEGQQPGGTDADSGYECDSNRGVGRGNPAHTGCEPAETPPATTGTIPPAPPAATGTIPPAPSANGAPPAPRAAPAPAPEAAREVPQDLAFTGLDLLPLGLAGLLLVGGGGAAVVMAGQSRRP